MALLTRFSGPSVPSPYLYNGTLRPNHLRNATVFGLFFRRKSNTVPKNVEYSMSNYTESSSTYSRIYCEELAGISTLDDTPIGDHFDSVNSRSVKWSFGQLLLVLYRFREEHDN